MKQKHFIITVFLFLGNFIQSQTSVASIFSDNMVLQRNIEIPVWGFANANEEITVTFHNQTKKTLTNKDGKWSVYLDNESAGGPFILSIKGKTKIEIRNVLVGEVWLCSGQSNMEWTIGQSDDAKNEIAKNGIVQTSSKVLNRFASDTDIQSTSLHVMLTMAPYQYLDFFVGNATDNTDFKFVSLNLVAIGMPN